jgi:hypothetical protein
MNKRLLKYALVSMSLFVILVFSSPINAFCDSVSIESVKEDFLSSNLPEYELNTSNFDDGIYIIIITSVIVVGILFFALWKTFKGRKQF